MKFSVFTNNLDNRMVCALSRLTDTTRWESGQHAGEHSGIQKDLQRSHDPAQSSTKATEDPFQQAVVPSREGRPGLTGDKAVLQERTQRVMLGN